MRVTQGEWGEQVHLPRGSPWGFDTVKALMCQSKVSLTDKIGCLQSLDWLVNWTSGLDH